MAARLRLRWAIQFAETWVQATEGVTTEQQEAPPRGGFTKLYRALWHFSEGSRNLVVAFFALLMSAQACRLAIPYFFGLAVNRLQDAQAQDLPGAAEALGLMLAAAVIGWTMHGPGRVVERYTALKIRERFADSVYGKLMRLPMSWHETHHSGDTIQRVNKANNALFSFAQNQYTYLQNAVGLIGPLIALFAISPPVGGTAIVAYALLGGIVLRLDRAFARLILDENRAERRYVATFVDSLGNVATVLTLRLEAATRSALARRLHEVFAPLRRSILINEAKWATIELFGQVLRILLVGFYAWIAWRANGVIMVGTAVMVHQYAQQIGDVVGNYANQWQDIVRAGADLGGSDEIFAAKERRGSGGAVPEGWREIHVQDLTFHHPSRRNPGPTLDRVDLKFQRGERVALVGESGSGKSSLMRVLTGLYDPDEVRFTIDGAPASDLIDLASAATLIPQDPEIFENTVLYNLTMGLNYTAEEVVHACDVASFGPILTSMPKGLETPIVERGGNLSGGQKQRLALARGILAARTSSLIMLDEPTSSLDPSTEARIYAKMMAEFPEACIVSSIHRLHLLPRFHKIVYMADGKVVDVGSIRELVTRQARFAELWNEATAQSREERANAS